ncbi:hypothetical protein [Xanthomonas sp. GPE 39]|uniref:hypothetical protein n=1 Tax=Xanthomonas sp. GPE 39 TaxID=1583099 RepID=UPI00137934DF|nr:hypothetical protein [Xanthomonas sp. GPE 39]
MTLPAEFTGAKTLAQPAPDQPTLARATANADAVKRNRRRCSSSPPVEASRTGASKNILACAAIAFWRLPYRFLILGVLGFRKGKHSINRPLGNSSIEMLHYFFQLRRRSADEAAPSNRNNSEISTKNVFRFTNNTTVVPPEKRGKCWKYSRTTFVHRDSRAPRMLTPSRLATLF